MQPTQKVSDTVSGEIRAQLARKRLTQGDLSTALGISQPQVSSRLLGRIGWSIDELATVAAWLDIPLADLVKDAA
ncbi:MAG: helix-turn-helix transcriptional regulator [Candidatus Nanopelagicales bacterium]|nr:helix-turn-helix transcriptional regulator [Candidatus Nanopelagicales bacterium]